METVIVTVSLLFRAYFIMIFIYILMSWIPGTRDSGFGQLIGKLVEPYLDIFRKIIPPLGMIDFSPIVAIIALNFDERGLMSILFNFL